MAALNNETSVPDSSALSRKLQLPLKQRSQSIFPTIAPSAVGLRHEMVIVFYQREGCQPVGSGCSSFAWISYRLPATIRQSRMNVTSEDREVRALSTSADHRWIMIVVLSTFYFPSVSTVGFRAANFPGGICEVTDNSVDR